MNKGTDCYLWKEMTYYGLQIVCTNQGKCKNSKIESRGLSKEGKSKKDVEGSYYYRCFTCNHSEHIKLSQEEHELIKKNNQKKRDIENCTLELKKNTDKTIVDIICIVEGCKREKAVTSTGRHSLEEGKYSYKCKDCKTTSIIQLTEGEYNELSKAKQLQRIFKGRQTKKQSWGRLKMRRL